MSACYVSHQVSSSSPSSSSSSSQHLSPMIRAVQLVPKSTSDRLLEKFFDATQYDFDYNEQSGLWSPPVHRSAFLSSQGKIFTEHEMHAKLTTLMAAQARSSKHHKLRCRIFPVVQTDALFCMTRSKRLSLHHINANIAVIAQRKRAELVKQCGPCHSQFHNSLRQQIQCKSKYSD